MENFGALPGKRGLGWVWNVLRTPTLLFPHECNVIEISISDPGVPWVIWLWEPPSFGVPWAQTSGSLVIVETPPGGSR